MLCTLISTLYIWYYQGRDKRPVEIPDVFRVDLEFDQLPTGTVK